jgi:hypothetical protein
MVMTHFKLKGASFGIEQKNSLMHHNQIINSSIIINIIVNGKNESRDLLQSFVSDESSADYFPKIFVWDIDPIFDQATLEDKDIDPVFNRPTVNDNKPFEVDPGFGPPKLDGCDECDDYGPIPEPVANNILQNMDRRERPLIKPAMKNPE